MLPAGCLPYRLGLVQVLFKLNALLGLELRTNDFLLVACLQG